MTAWNDPPLSRRGKIENNLAGLVLLVLALAALAWFVGGIR